MSRRAAIRTLSLLACAVGLLVAWRSASPPVRPPVDAARSGNFHDDLPLRAPARIKSPRYRSEPVIRVGLTESPVRQLTLEIAGPYQIRPTGDSRVLKKGRSLSATRVVATDKGIRVGNDVLGGRHFEIIPDKSPAIWVNDHQYRGRVQLHRRDSNSILPVNVLPLEQYVASVVDSEMPAAFPVEARRSQAIVARTYALYQHEQAPRAALVDVYASTRSQKYLGFQYRDPRGRLLAGESASSRDVADATRGLVAMYQGELFCTYYCAVCGGTTIAGQQVFSDAAPPLRPVRCEWCREAKLYRWQSEITRKDAQSDLQGAFAREGKKLGNLKSIAAAAGRKGKPDEFQVRDDRQTLSISAADMRQALGGRGLYSPHFSVEDRGNSFRFSGRGHGHGVGLCQWGARGLAFEGRTAAQIIEHYYPGTAIAELAYR